MIRTDLALFLATSGHSGVDRIMRNLVPEFVARGLRVDLLQVRGRGPYWEDLPEGARLIDLGVNHVNTALPALVRYLRDTRPQALLSDKDKVNRVALMARALTGVPTRVGVRIGTTVSTNLARRGAWSRYSQYASIRLFYRFADTLITPSLGAAEDLARIAGLPVHRVTVCPSPVVSERMVQLSEQPVGHPWLQDQNVPVILGVGELCARKDFSTLIKAFALVRKQRPCRLIVGGEGRQREKLEALAMSLGISEDVDLPGFLDNPYAYMKHANIFALTSVCEGFGLVLMEALALGTPVVSTDCPSGPREILDNGRYGALVAVGDVETLAEKILTTLTHPLPANLLQQASLPYMLSHSATRYLQALGFETASPGNV